MTAILRIHNHKVDATDLAFHLKAKEENAHCTVERLETQNEK